MTMSIGDRIVYGEKRGTIHFIGEVPPFAGVWYGVDWDAPNDGKHDGTYKGVRYFHATYPKSGSFVKSTDVNFGCKFVDALKEQYDYDVKKAREDYEESMKDFPVTVFDFVNLEKVKRLQGPLSLLQVVNLAPYNIGSPGEPGEIERTCPNIADLDLSNNLMTSWESIVVIGKQLKNLRCLTLNDSRLEVPAEPEKFKHAFTKLKDLFLCRMLYTWDDILSLSVMWPQIEILKVPFCRIEHLASPENVLQNLRHLDIQGNKVYKWSEINKLGRLPNLEVLNVCDMGITEIVIPKEKKLFLKVHTLYASENYIRDLADIVDLNYLPTLKDLRINKNPLTTNDKFLSYREKIIARIGNLMVLNGREIMADERRSAEYDYLREFAKDWMFCMNDEKEKTKFSMKNPRYEYLVKKYGPAEVPNEIDPALKGHLITVNLVYVDEHGAQKIIKKRVHLSLAVYKLIAIAKRAFVLKIDAPKLVRVSTKNPAIKVDMRDPMKVLNIYAVEDGDTIYINH